MKCTEDKMARAVARFTAHQEIMRQIADQDNEFYALCCDYGECAEALRFWRQSQDPRAEDRVSEYRTLLQELENEILLFLRSSPAGRNV